MVFSEMLKNFLEGHSLGHLSEQTGITQATLKNWISGRADTRGPQKWSPIVRLASALRLTALETTELLESAGKSAFEQIRQLPPDEEMAQEQERTAKAIDEILARSTATVNARLRSPLHVNVPPIPNLFIGRGELVAEFVERLLSSHTLAISSQRVSGADKTKIAMDGLPGIGKTAMAVMLAHHPKVLAYFKDGVLWGGLGQQPNAMRILAQWGDALGEDVSKLITEKERSQAIRSAIGQRCILIVIDDAWDVRNANYLRCGGPNCCHLLTTRNFQVAREFAGLAQVETLPILDEVASWQLLEALAPEVCRADTRSVQRLINMAGGLPLTLVLLGGFLAAPEHSMFEDLSQKTLQALNGLSDTIDPTARLQLAMERLGTLDDRVVTLQQVIALSLEVLPEEIQRTFNALGTFAPKPEWFGREAAEYVAKTNTRTLAILIACNLVERISNTQLALHQTLADVARIETQADTVTRHREYYLSLVGEDEKNWQRIETIYGQIKWAWKAAPEDYIISAKFITLLGDYQKRRALWGDKVIWMQSVLRIAVERNWQGVVGLLCNDLGLAYEQQGRWDEAISKYEESLAISTETGDKHSQATTLMNLGNVYDKKNCLDKAIVMHDAALSIRVELADKLGFRDSIEGLGLIDAHRKRWSEAIHKYEISLSISQELGDRYREGKTLINLGCAYAAQRLLAEAALYFEQSLNILQEEGYVHDQGIALMNLGLLSMDMVRPGDAEVYWQKALEKLKTESIEHVKTMEWLKKYEKLFELYRWLRE
jgi:tetratricopeptide (TPR) repeat protein